MRDVEADAGLLAEDGDAMGFCAGGEEGVGEGWTKVDAVLGVGGVEYLVNGWVAKGSKDCSI